MACSKHPAPRHHGPSQAPKPATRSDVEAHATTPLSGPSPAPQSTSDAAAPHRDQPSSSPALQPRDTPNAVGLGRVYLQPLGRDLEAADLEFIAQTLGVFYTLSVTVCAPLDLPAEAYYPPRSRYRAEKLLDYLAEVRPLDAHVIVGLTTVDISTTKGAHADWGVLGLATVAGKDCVISKFRAGRGAKDQNHTRERLAKTVVHEVGHTLALPHCPHEGCLMEDGQGTVTTTDHEFDLCPSCQALVSSWVRPHSKLDLPWPDPRVP